ncbi:hypothetical protein SmJEL517_g01073 [Synchytrium microbalum]|uniref:Eukaryotic translation initiation factor 3 subunit D n=1 Tax=Synchytrium microbalum TaxID=1806994 RepID=A0A507CGL5_9FUNG|nr:uncharacterized protein SmJEL517_g01073 [Synchytrium microbalum]TPX37186.1 hypothetical protein SmJEL517_g01073 [Synchytrium microbalum]
MPVPESTISNTHFATPIVYDNPNGWGPSTLPAGLSEIPYAPYSKSDRLGRVADWTIPADDYYYDRNQNTGTGGDRRQQRRGDDTRGDNAPTVTADGTTIPPARQYRRGGPAGYRGGNMNEPFGVGTASAFDYKVAAEDEATFSLVSTTSSKPKLGGFRPSRGRGGAFGIGAGRGGYSDVSRGRTGFNENQQRVGRYANARGGNTQGGWRGRRFGYQDKPQRVRDASVKIAADWKVLQEMDFNALSKLFYEVEAPEDLEVFGEANYYDKVFDRVSAKNSQPLKSFDRFAPNLTTSFDPVLQKLSKEVDGPTVFATDNVLSTLMCATRSVYSWDIVIQKEGDKLFLDKRDGTQFDFVSVNENAAEAPLESAEKENPNTPQQLALEGTYVNKNFSQQVLKQAEKYTLDNENPFVDPSVADQDPPASAIYRYRKWQLGEDLALVARTQIDAVIHTPGSSSTSISEELIPDSSAHPVNDTLLLNIKALNEFDSKAPGAGGAPDWRQKLDSQRGAVMATEIKNNGNKLARWTMECILAGVDQIRIGFVSRVSPKDRSRHVVLGTAYFKPKELANQMNLNVPNSFGILKVISDLCMKLEDGKYVLVKDPNKPLLRLYSVPLDTFEEDDGGDDEDMPIRDDGDMDE